MDIWYNQKLLILGGDTVKGVCTAMPAHNVFTRLENFRESAFALMNCTVQFACDLKIDQSGKIWKNLEIEKTLGT